MKLLRVFVIGLALGVPALSIAQWQWLDKDGRKVFSDQPPPADVPAKNILRRPAGKSSVAIAPDPSPAASAIAAASSQPARPAASMPKPSGKDKDLEEKKRIADAATAEKKKSEAEEVARVKADNCVRAKQSKATLDSGQRIAVTNAKGEQEVMDDNARARENRRLDGIIASECKPAGG
ncbi:MAG: DUF4124 domain-containing protein [Ramlibacter sp.]|nr:DUF4124 domain-containing protein [Ramlibacter sp.]